ncbi:hypothetical protein KV201_07070 [Shewanella sp. SR1]|uniref:hypothetical protein n=1 Tax=Shewanella sp. SR1 TaxID=2855505 RepID=UPI001CF41458|nr:hypothetical protein [Shewanella sp. SR1]MCB2381936.1 hypothetical protein [Shewanella sp. SR1]
MEKYNFFSFITVSHGHFEDIKKLVISIDKYWLNTCELIIVDNKNEFVLSDFDFLCENDFLTINLIRNHKLKSFSENNNLAVANAKYEKIFIINPDVEFFNSSVFDKYISLDLQAIVYPKLLNSDFSDQVHYNEWPNIIGQLKRLLMFKLNHDGFSYPRNKDWFFAAAIILRKVDFLSVGGFNEAYPLYCEDVDFYHRLLCNRYVVLYDEEVTLVHHLGGDSKGKYLSKAIYSNLVWRYYKIKNILFCSPINKPD